jgi:glycosyltransferase involved in cell wall biosynthesis
VIIITSVGQRQAAPQASCNEEQHRAVRVVHVNDIAFVATNLVAGLNAAGHDARLRDPAKPGGALRYPWKLATIPVRLGLLTATAGAIRRDAPDIVHIHYASQSLVGALAGRPFIVHCHGTDIRGVDRSSLRGRCLAPFLASAAAVLYSTVDLGDDARSFRPDAKFLPSPIDTDHFVPGPPASRDVLVAMRLDSTKGATAIMQALDLVLARRPETTATVIAFGAQAATLTSRLGPRVSVIPRVGHDEMPRLIQDHRVAIGQLSTGALDVTELETMACGVPVVAHFRYDPRCYPEPPPVLQAADPGSVADGLISLLDHEDARREAAVKGRSWTLAQHSLPVVTRRLVAIYERVLSGRGKAA